MTHGTRYAWRSGCRCAACRAWKADDVRRYRRHRPARGPRAKGPYVWPTPFPFRAGSDKGPS